LWAEYKLTAEPTAKQGTLRKDISDARHKEREGTYDQTEQVVEHGNRLSDDPCNGPSAQGNTNPGSECERAVLVHVVGAIATEDAYINVLASNVTKYNTRNNDLLRVRIISKKLK
jgi:hypothetical protein